jgi:multimeric flavodoxin WrbA
MNTVLGIVGSPRRDGNTHVLVSAVLDGAAGVGAGTEALLLGDMNIRECDGCHACWAGKPCPKNDDMNAVYPKIAASDVIVFGTPVYWYGPTALMKALIDRLVYFNCPEHRPMVRGKWAAIVAPFEEQDVSVADLLVAMFARSLQYLEMKLAGTILAPGVGRKGEVRQKTEVMAAARRLGESLAACEGVS